MIKELTGPVRSIRLCLIIPLSTLAAETSFA
jgi:hypothetical protein